MRPDQFTMWLRGVLDSVGEGKSIPGEISAKIYDRLTEVVGRQVAENLAERMIADRYLPKNPILGGIGVGTATPNPFPGIGQWVETTTTDTTAGPFWAGDNAAGTAVVPPGTGSITTTAGTTLADFRNAMMSQKKKSV